ncbi:hypothetical protein S245_023418 [Arachis hypogaea]
MWTRLDGEVREGDTAEKNWERSIERDRFISSVLSFPSSHLVIHTNDGPPVNFPFHHLFNKFRSNRMIYSATTEKGRIGEKAGYGKRKGKGKGKGVPPRVCPQTLLPREIWERIALRVASSSIQDLFNMQATCKVFLDICRSSAVFKVASMAEIPVVFGYDLEDRPEDGFLCVCTRAGNPGAIFRIGIREFCWMGRHVAGVDTLLEAADAGDVQARYMCAMLLLTPGVGDGADAGRGVEMFENVLAAGKIEMCREIFGQLFANPLIGVHPSDPGKPVVCRSSLCPTRGTMGATNDSSTVSCVHCVAEFEVLHFFSLFTFR